jgi:hypothetical protein
MNNIKLGIKGKFVSLAVALLLIVATFIFGILEPKSICHFGYGFL